MTEDKAFMCWLVEKGLIKSNEKSISPHPQLTLSIEYDKLSISATGYVQYVHKHSQGKYTLFI